MSRRALSAACGCVVILAALAGAAPAGEGIFPYPYETHTLDNGLTVITIPTPTEGLVSYYTIVRTGSRDEVEEGHTGFAHFFEHMMFRGTELYPGPEYNRIMTELGADGNAYTTDDLTAYYYNFAAEDLDRIVELEADRFQNLSYAEREFQTEAGAVYGEYRKGRTNPFFVLYEAMQDEAFDEHTYGHTTIGYEADIAAMPTMYDYSRSFFRRFYRPDNIVIVVAGDIEPDGVMETIRARYGDWEPGYEVPDVPVEPEQTAPKRVEVDYEGRTLPLLGVYWKAPAFDGTDEVAVAGSMIGELLFGSTSELYQRLVIDEQTVQTLYEDFGTNRDPGLWGTIAMVRDPGRVDDVEEAIEDAVAELAAEGPAADRLEALKRRVRYGFLMNLATPGQVAGGLARFVAITGGIEPVERYLATVEDVTAEDVQRAAQRYLTEARRTVALVKGAEG